MKKILLITMTVIALTAMFAGCKNPAGSIGEQPKPSSPSVPPSSGGGSTPAQITITVAGDEHVTLKPTHTFKVKKGVKKWYELKAEAEDKIDRYDSGYGADKWKLTNAVGQDLTNDYVFNTDTTVFIVTKLTSASPEPKITITIKGDAGVILKEPEPKITPTKGQEWKQIKSLAEEKINKYKPHYELKNWHLTDASGTVLDDNYTTPFNDDAIVFIETKLEDVQLTITGDDHVDITSAIMYKPWGTKWSEIKAEVMGKVTPRPDFVILAWKKDRKTGTKLNDNFQFRGKTAIYVETRPINVTITIKGDGYAQSVADPKITKLYGAKWGEIKDEAKEKITLQQGYVLAAWKKDSATAESELSDSDKFEKDTEVYATTQAVPVSVGVKVNTVTIIGKDVNYALPKKKDPDTSKVLDALWFGVFPAGRTVTLTEYTIGKYEVTVQLWKTVYEWANNNGYKFEYDAEEKDYNDDNQPMTDISWRDCIAWCNAYSEMKFGNTDHCVYRKNSQTGTAVKDANTEADNAYCDLTKKGYRLPTEVEWEYAARYQGIDSDNAESYGSVHLTKLDSASGAKQPIGFKDMTLPNNQTYDTLREETARVAVFNKWWDGTEFKSQTPEVTELSDVGKKAANKLGIFDMSGNALEWCWDRYSDNVGTGNVKNPTGASSPLPSDTKRVLRGGNWSKDKADAVYECMVGKRDYDTASADDPLIGFRLVWKD